MDLHHRGDIVWMWTSHIYCLTLVRRTKSTFVRYIYERPTTLAPTNEESAWLNEEKNLIGKKMFSYMSASDVSRVVSLVY